MGGKLFRYILEYLDEDVSELPMRDILNKLERFQIVPDAHEWVYIRELRNNVAHDYPMSDNEVVSAVNELISKLNAVLGIYHNLKNIYMG